MKCEMRRKMGIGIVITLIGLTMLSCRSSSRPSAPGATIAQGTAVAPIHTYTPEPIPLKVTILPTVTSSAPGGPTLPPEALAMQAAPTATPSPIPPLPSPTPTATATPTPVPATGHDNVPMVEVSAGEFIMGNTVQDTRHFIRSYFDTYNESLYPHETFHDEVPRLVVYLDAFLIDQMPVTNRRYRQCVEAGYCPPISIPDYVPAAEITDYTTGAAFDDYPVFTTWAGARTYCEWVGKRLPTESEWEKAARGVDGRLYPWGNEWDETIDLRELSPVGSHPQDVSPFDVLDMVGNGQEWTLDLYTKYPGITQLEPELALMLADVFAINARTVRGGRGTPLESRVAVRTHQGPSLSVAGLRCVKSESLPVLAQAIREIVIPATTPIPTLVPTTEPDLSDMVYIPAGEFIMGTDQSYFPHEDSTPAHIVYLDAYYIDRTQVTVAEYAVFMNALHDALNVKIGELCGGQRCASWGHKGEFRNHLLLQDERLIVDDPQYADYPITEVYWEGADAYCRWLGKRLPTEAEWEKAMRGTDGRRYPWGNEERPNLTFSPPFELHPVGSAPENASPYGVLDIITNMQEWVADYYAEDYYTWSPAIDPKGPNLGVFRVLRGVYFGNPEMTLVAREGTSTGGSFMIGFRCAYRPDR